MRNYSVRRRVKRLANGMGFAVSSYNQLGGMTMSDVLDEDVKDEHVPASQVPGAHESDGTLGRTAGTGSGAIAGGIVGSSVAGPVGTVVGAVAGAALGHAAGDAAHKIGDDHDDVNIETGRDGDGARAVGSGTGAVAGGVVGSTAGPVGTVAGAVAGGMLGAAAGDATKDMGGDDTASAPDNNYGTTDTVTGDRVDDSPGPIV